MYASDAVEIKHICENLEELENYRFCLNEYHCITIDPICLTCFDDILTDDEIDYLLIEANKSIEPIVDKFKKNIYR